MFRCLPIQHFFKCITTYFMCNFVSKDLFSIVSLIFMFAMRHVFTQILRWTRVALNKQFSFSLYVGGRMDIHGQTVANIVKMVMKG